jgi:Fe-S-cluster containining protein
LYGFKKGKFNVMPNPEVCKECGGKCCSGPVSTCASDFDIRPYSVKDIISLLKTKKFSPTRMTVEVVPHGDGHICIFWTENGCILPADERPFLCRYFGPHVDGRGWGKYNCGYRFISSMDEWRWKKSILEKATKAYLAQGLHLS